MTIPKVEALPSVETAGRASRALEDLASGLMQWRLWIALAGRDIQRGYRGSFFGHVWIALSLGIFILIVGNIYTLVFEIDAATYVPFLCSGLIAWRFMTSLILEGGSVFLGSGGFIKGFAIPLSVFLYKSILKNVIMFGHYLVVYVIVAAILSVPVNASTLLLIPGLLIVAFNGLWMLALMGLICTRFRDVEQLVSSVMILLFFVTPVLWPENRVEQMREIVIFNPFYHFLEILRDPLLGQTPDPLSWLVTLGIAVVGVAVTFPLFARFRTRLVFWI